MKKQIEKFLNEKVYYLILIFIISSCASRQDVVYFQNIDAVQNSKSINSYTPVYKVDDLLAITVSALDQDAALAFNLGSPGTSSVSSDGGDQEAYLIDSKGNIEFPVLGKLKMAGLNRIEATSMLTDLLKEYIKNPIVNIRTLNFKITVLGEVTSPGVFTIPNERITVIEALGLAGDLTIQGLRENILVIRDNNGTRTHGRIDLRSEEVFNSPYYYLSQNDVVYVEANKTKINTSKAISGTTTTVISIISSAIAIAIALTR